MEVSAFFWRKEKEVEIQLIKGKGLFYFSQLSGPPSVETTMVTSFTTLKYEYNSGGFKSKRFIKYRQLDTAHIRHILSSIIQAYNYYTSSSQH